MTASANPLVQPELLDDTVEMLLDTHSAVTSTLADQLPLAELEGLLRELTHEILDVYRTVVDEEGQR